jgi:hypothetical protein
MSKTIDTLKRIFSDSFIEASHDNISEPKEDMVRKICKGGIADEDILICRLDQEGGSNYADPFPYIKGDSVNHGLRGMKRVSDYVMFVDKDGVLFVLIFELKKGKESPKEQLDVTEPLIDFIFNRAKILKHFGEIKYEVRKIGITEEVGKRSTSERGEIIYDNRFVRLYRGKYIYLRKLLH